MHTLPRSAASAAERSSLKTTTPSAPPAAPGIGTVGDGDDLGLALVVRDREARVGLDPREPLLRLVEELPGALDRHVEGAVRDDVAAAEEVVVLDARRA
jgi:hypothetical protein